MSIYFDGHLANTSLKFGNRVVHFADQFQYFLNYRPRVLATSEDGKREEIVEVCLKCDYKKHYRKEW
jgi:hypothetical protein